MVVSVSVDQHELMQPVDMFMSVDLICLRLSRATSQISSIGSLNGTIDMFAGFYQLVPHFYSSSGTP